MNIQEQIMILRLQGLSYRVIAKRVGLSSARIGQILTAPRPIRLLVRDRARDQCEDCFLHLSGRGQVHHRNVTGTTPDTYNDLSQLEYLCLSCHRDRHRGPQTRQKNFRLSHEDRQLLATLAKQLGINKSAILGLAIRRFADTQYLERT